MISLASLMLLMSITLAVAEDAPKPDAKPSTQDKTATIKSVDAGTKTFVLNLAARPLTFTWDDKTEFTLDGKPSTADAVLKADLSATVSYTRSGDTRQATKVAVTTPAAKEPAKEPTK
jgi:hypothetical protein